MRNQAISVDANYMTVEEACEHFKTSRRSIFRLIKAGLPSVRSKCLGRRILREQADAWFLVNGHRKNHPTIIDKMSYQLIFPEDRIFPDSDVLVKIFERDCGIRDPAQNALEVHNNHEKAAKFAQRPIIVCLPQKKWHSSEELQFYSQEVQSLKEWIEEVLKVKPNIMVKMS